MSRVLVIEDDLELTRVIRNALTQAGFSVETSADGEDGLLKATQSDFDVITLDVMLPSLSGMTLLRQLRAARQTPVLILSGIDALEKRVEALDAGADDFMIKPFEIVELVARLRALVRRSTTPMETVISIEDITVDVQTRLVKRNGLAIDLTPSEYALLEMLSLKRGKLVTRKYIYEHLFDESEMNLSNLLDVHMSNLRKKLGATIITTRRGQGYIIEHEAEAAETVPAENSAS